MKALSISIDSNDSGVILAEGLFTGFLLERNVPPTAFDHMDTRGGFIVQVNAILAAIMRELHMRGTRFI